MNFLQTSDKTRNRVLILQKEWHIMIALQIGGIKMDDGDSNTANTALYCIFLIRNIESIAGIF